MLVSGCSRRGRVTSPRTCLGDLRFFAGLRGMRMLGGRGFGEGTVAIF